MVLAFTVNASVRVTGQGKCDWSVCRHAPPERYGRKEGARMKQLIRGGFAGLLATGTMSLVMAGGKAAGLLHSPPPKKITKHAEQQTGVNPHAMPQETFDASWVAAHVGYGAMVGVVYAMVRRVLPKSPVVRGLIYGEAVWAVSYLGVLPALGLYELPEDRTLSQTAVMLAAHAVYGVTLAEADQQGVL